MRDEIRLPPHTLPYDARTMSNRLHCSIEDRSGGLDAHSYGFVIYPRYGFGGNMQSSLRDPSGAANKVRAAMSGILE